MNIKDIIAFIIIFIPVIKMVVFDQDELTKKKQFIMYLVIGIISWVIGAIYYQQSATEDKGFVYLSSQCTLNFLIIFNLISIPYRKIFKRNPEISKVPTNLIDIIPTILVTIGTILLPLLLDAYFIKYAIK